jgi:CubicO group peptidase (beta-lactamase class C family)
VSVRAVVARADAPVHGFVASGFEPVVEAFARNFVDHGELGAAFAAACDGELVVDLWGGVADPASGRAWERDTLQLLFSGTKALVAICLLLLIDRGQLELDAPVARWWPEFAVAGKEAVAVRQVVTHTAGLPGLTTAVTMPDLVDDRRMAGLLAAQPLFEDPRAFRTYHAMTFGWLCGELVRRIDGRTVGRFFMEEVAGPLELDLHLGLPAALEQRVSRLVLAETWGSNPSFDPCAGDPLLRAVWGNPVHLTRETFPWNDRAFHAAEIPASNAIGTMRAVALLFGSLARLLSPEALALGRSELERRHDPLAEEPAAYGVGFMLQTERTPFGPPVDAFGHGGAGGSMHGAWPSQRVGFSYGMNLLRDDAPRDPRAAALLDALHDCLEDGA